MENSELAAAARVTDVGRLRSTEPRPGDLAIFVRLDGDDDFNASSRLARDAVLGALARAGLVTLPEYDDREARRALEEFPQRGRIASVRHAVYGRSGTWM